MDLINTTDPSLIDWILVLTMWSVLFGTAYHLLWGKRIAEQKVQKSLPSGRHRYARTTVTNEIKKKLVSRFSQEKDMELLAEDIIEVIAVANNDPDTFYAAAQELDRLASFKTE